ncbi:MAG: VanZ family protein [Clostridiales bacterium]|nr:VanZ family protein [Clostridiales bacterium]
MINAIGKVITDVLQAFYQPLWFALLLSFFVMLAYMLAGKRKLKEIIKQFINKLKSDSFYRRLFLLVFFTVMILFQTLLNRNMWINPLSDVIGVWGIYDSNGNFTAEIFENMLLFLPFTLLLFWTFSKKILKKITLFYVLKQSLIISFLFSLGIELCQLLLRVGTFQLSDIFYNTLGGLAGGIFYWLIRRFLKIKNKN